MVFVRQLCGSWGGGHLGGPTLLRSVPFLLPFDVSQGDVHGLPTKYFQHGQALLWRNFQLFLTPVAPCRSDGVFVVIICGTALCPFTRLIPTEIAVSADSQTPCWNMLTWVSGQLWRGLPFHWAVRCGPLIFSAVV